MGRRRMKNYNPMAIAESPMTAPDSRDSVERVVAEMREAAEAYAGHHASGTFRRLSDRLQALARGPQQAGGEDAEASIRSEIYMHFDGAGQVITGKETIVRCVAVLIEDRVAALQAEVARLRAGIVHRGDGVVVPLHLYDEINATGAAWKQRAEAAEAALREAGRPVGYVYSEIVDTEGTQPVRIKRAVLQGEYAQSLPNGTPLYAALNGGQDDNA